MTQGKLTDPSVQQQVLNYVDAGKKPKWIMDQLGLSKCVFYRIVKRGQIQQKNNYRTKPGPKNRVRYK